MVVTVVVVVVEVAMGAVGVNHSSTGVSAGVSARGKFVLEFEIRCTKTVFRDGKYGSLMIN